MALLRADLIDRMQRQRRKDQARQTDTLARAADVPARYAQIQTERDLARSRDDMAFEHQVAGSRHLDANQKNNQRRTNLDEEKFRTDQRNLADEIERKMKMRTEDKGEQRFALSTQESAMAQIGALDDPTFDAWLKSRDANITGAMAEKVIASMQAADPGLFGQVDERALAEGALMKAAQKRQQMRIQQMNAEKSRSRGSGSGSGAGRVQLAGTRLQAAVTGQPLPKSMRVATPGKAFDPKREVLSTDMIMAGEAILSMISAVEGDPEITVGAAKNLVQNLSSHLSFMDGWVDENWQENRSLQEAMLDQFARLRTGAAFTNSEAERFERIIGSFGKNNASNRASLSGFLKGEIRQLNNHRYTMFGTGQNNVTNGANIDGRGRTKAENAIMINAIVQRLQSGGIGPRHANYLRWLEGDAETPGYLHFVGIDPSALKKAQGREEIAAALTQIAAALGGQGGR